MADPLYTGTVGSQETGTPRPASVPPHGAGPFVHTQALYTDSGHWPIVDRGALLSPCQVYRYLLWRKWDQRAPHICYIMLNPSTADEEVDDATVRVCMGRARHMGYGGIEVVNLFALRSTDPDMLYRHPFPISEYEPLGRHRNDFEIERAACSSKLVICAWGAHGSYLNRAETIHTMLKYDGVKLQALRINKDRSPAHPLRIPYSEPLKEFV